MGHDHHHKKSQPVVGLELVPALIEGGEDDAGDEPDLGVGILG